MAIYLKKKIERKLTGGHVSLYPSSESDILLKYFLKMVGTYINYSPKDT